MHIEHLIRVVLELLLLVRHARESGNVRGGIGIGVAAHATERAEQCIGPVPDAAVLGSDARGGHGQKLAAAVVQMQVRDGIVLGQPIRLECVQLARRIVPLERPLIRLKRRQHGCGRGEHGRGAGQRKKEGLDVHEAAPQQAVAAVEGRPHPLDQLGRAKHGGARKRPVLVNGGSDEAFDGEIRIVAAEWEIVDSDRIQKRRVAPVGGGRLGAGVGTSTARSRGGGDDARICWRWRRGRRRAHRGAHFVQAREDGGDNGQCSRQHSGHCSLGAPLGGLGAARRRVCGLGRGCRHGCGTQFCKGARLLLAHFANLGENALQRCRGRHGRFVKKWKSC